MISLDGGKKLIRLARESISCVFSKKDIKVDKETKQKFSMYRGVFVTLNRDGMLRGCIGFPEPVYPLYEGVIKAARSAAFSDPRFPPISMDEFGLITIDVSVLTKPQRIVVRNPEDYMKEIKVGRDGLIVRGTFHSGLLLPQVAVEYNWDSKTFLEQTCNKAGLPIDAWRDFDECRVYRFQSIVFSEVSPGGEVRRLM